VGVDVGVSVGEQLERAGYLAAPDFANLVEIAVAMGRPLLLEGPAGVGKTALAPALAAALDQPLVRLQCYEGIDAAQALYDWNYARQLADLAQHRERDVFSAGYLVARPLLQALTAETGAVLLIDEVDRADEAFEALLLEVLGEGQITVPEIGTYRRAGPLHAVLTSNRTRALSDALRRRCLFVRIGWPDPAREAAILGLHHPAAARELRQQVAGIMGRLRSWDLVKAPGLAESLDLTAAALFRGIERLDPSSFAPLLGTVIKDAADWDLVAARLPELFDGG
jgi:MoxR-like ATPase